MSRFAKQSLRFSLSPFAYAGGAAIILRSHVSRLHNTASAAGGSLKLFIKRSLRECQVVGSGVPIMVGTTVFGANEDELFGLQKKIEENEVFFGSQYERKLRENVAVLGWYA